METKTGSNPWIPNSTQTPDCLFDELMPVLEGTDSKIMFYLARQTFGWRRPSCRLSYAEFAAGTGVDVRWTRRRLLYLLEVGILRREQTRTPRGRQYLYSLNLEMDLPGCIETLRSRKIPTIIKRVNECAAEGNQLTMGLETHSTLGLDAHSTLGLQTQVKAHTKTNKYLKPPLAPGGAGGTVPKNPPAGASPEMPAKVRLRIEVCEQLGIDDRPTERAIERQAERALRSQPAEAIVAAMVAQYQAYMALNAAGRLVFTVGPDKFFGQGLWHDTKRWTVKESSAGAASVGMQPSGTPPSEEEIESSRRFFESKWMALKSRQNSGLQLNSMEKSQLRYFAEMLGPERVTKLEAELGRLAEAV